MSSRAGHEQQMFEDMNGQQLMVKRSHWEPPRHIKNIRSERLTAVLKQEWAMSICRH
jgi:hypothetical protein